MKGQIKIFLRASSIIVGTIVGVGIFALPYAFAQTGFFIGLALLFFFAAVFLYLHLLYGEVVLRTRRKKRLVGYAKKYLGQWGKITASTAALFGLLGAQLAYLIIGGKFLSLLFEKTPSPAHTWLFMIIFSLAGSLVMLKNSRAIAKVELLMSIFLIALIFLIFGAAAPKIETENFLYLHPSNAFLAYGVILFSLSGTIAIPETIEYLKKKKNHNFKNAIIFGTLLPVSLYILFVIATLGVAGRNISESAIDSLSGLLGNNVFLIGLIFGVLAVFTSFITVGINLVKILWYDYRMSKFISWFLISIMPLVLFTLGFRHFINIIGIVGSVMGGINGILIILIYQKARKNGDEEPAYNIGLPKLLKWLLFAVFILGIFYQIHYAF